MGKRFRDTWLEIPKGYKVPGTRQQGERIIEIGIINIDCKVFKKTPEEKIRLNNAKAKSKNASN